MRTSKRCPHCLETKPLAEFIRPRAGTPSDHCHPCRQAKRRREYHRAGGAERSYRQALARHGVTPDQYQALLERQQGRCAACRTPPAGPRLGVVTAPQGHITLLCRRCQLLTSHDPAVLRAVADYLDTH